MWRWPRVVAEGLQLVEGQAQQIRRVGTDVPVSV